MHRSIAAAVVSAVAAATLPFGTPATAAPAAVAAGVTTTSGCLTSVPDPGTAAPVDICFTIFRPAGASKKDKVPMVLHSHGWGGSRTTDPAAFSYLTDAGFGVLSFDQRGFGESGGQAHIENPKVEGKDVTKIVDLIAAKRWVEKDTPGDPVLGAIGGSYGGGYQLVGAFSEIRAHGRTRFDALVPEITWWSLNESLLPQGVPRTEWAAALIAAGLPTNALPPIVLQGFAETTATGNVPAYLHDFLDRNGPEWHVRQGRRLDIPVLFGQGATDNVFPLDQGLQNFSRALTRKARTKSIFVGYNGGHTLPSLLPAGSNVDIPLATTDACSPILGSATFADLGLRFLKKNLQGTKKTGLRGFGKFHLTTAAGDRCVKVASVAPNTSVELGDVVSTVGVGVPVAYPVAEGPITIAGSPSLDGRITTLGLDNRAFLALSVGTSPLDAKIVQNNMLPIREAGITIDQPRAGVTLPSVAVDVPAGQTLFLTVSPISDMAAGFGSRVVGAMKLTDVVVHLPVARD